MIIIHAVMHVNPVNNEGFLQGIQTLIAASREEDGNISYSLHKDTEKEFTYTMIEVWKGPDAVSSHNQSAHFQAFAAKARSYLTAPLSIKAYTGEPLEIPAG
ncbi:putative quinol monooxygenase [Paenibacillus medicaginis]|uniref:Quinol monooxygenase n=1 Tax=Paenibacillus medicaginis TaxID=1470560 RepID=A0ABV5C1F8_9BACL